MNIIEELGVEENEVVFVSSKSTKSITVSSSGKVKFELFSFRPLSAVENKLVGVGFVPAWGTTTLPFDSEVTFVRIHNKDKCSFDVYYQFNE